MERLSSLIGKDLREPHGIVPYILHRILSFPSGFRYRFLWYKYRNRPYGEFYSEVMKICTAEDPKAAVGGKWDEIGKLQFEFLLQQGLRPHHKLLDFGCGCLRGGIHFIRYLDKGNYYGIDVSADILEAGRRFLSDAGLEDKTPVLRINTDLMFDGFHGEVFDFILAQSVFTHMPLSDIEECLENIHRVMDNNTVFFATFNEGGDKCFTRSYLTFYYPFDTLRDIGEKNGYEVILIENFAHPRKQKMMKIALR